MLGCTGAARRFFLGGGMEEETAEEACSDSKSSVMEEEEASESSSAESPSMTGESPMASEVRLVIDFKFFARRLLRDDFDDKTEPLLSLSKSSAMDDSMAEEVGEEANCLCTGGLKGMDEAEEEDCFDSKSSEMD